MPQYKYNCKDCKKTFSVYASMSESRENIVCEHCKSHDVHRVFSGIITKAGGLSPDTAAYQAASSTSSSTGGGCSSFSGGSCGSGCH